MNLPVTPTPPIYTDGTNWARNINIGAVNEGIGLGQEGQQLVFTLTNTNQGMFVRQPSLDSAGTLTFELQPNANGVAVVTVNSADTGSVGPPGSNQGPTCQFTITVLPVSDAPTFTLPATQPLIVHEDDPPSLTDFPTFMTNINRGPLDEAGQVISLSVENSNTALFTVQPRLEMISTNTARLAFELAPDMCGQAILHITVADDGDIQQCNGKRTVDDDSELHYQGGMRERPTIIPPGACVLCEEDNLHRRRMRHHPLRGRRGQRLHTDRVRNQHCPWSR